MENTAERAIVEEERRNEREQRVIDEIEEGDVYTRFRDYYEFVKVLGTGAFGKVV